jgi:hypothetical protein
MDEQQEQFLQAVYAVQNNIGHARVRDIATHLGLDIINNKADCDLYQKTTLQLQDRIYLDCLANDYGLTCGIVRLTPRGAEVAES